MNTNKIYDINKDYLELPFSLEKPILLLFGVSSFDKFSSTQKDKISNSLSDLFSQTKKVDYSKIAKEYTLYYLPINMYKVWRPLMDLLEKNQIKEQCSILELGSGPGTTTFGVMEFYKYLAEDNPSIIFELKFELVEIEKAFLKVFKSIVNEYIKALPANLKVSFDLNEANFIDFVRMNTKKYDYIIESNLLNNNEKILDLNNTDFSIRLNGALNKNGSVIFIEPAGKDLSQTIKELKFEMVKNGFGVYSPCCCNKKDCKQFPLASVNISNMTFINNLYENTIVTRKSYKPMHYFEYVVFRNDDLKKNQPFNNVKLLNDLSKYIGEKINFKANILYFMQDDEDYKVKVCDGSLETSKEVWLTIPKKIICGQAINPSMMGRGGTINIKNTKVVSNSNVLCSLSTRISMER